MTKAWVLVLLIGGGNGYKNPEMGIIKGFNSKAECLVAGQQVDDISTVRVKFTCVKR